MKSLNPDLKVVNGDKVWKERQDVFDLEQVAARQTVHGLLHVLLLLHHVPGDLQPKLLSQLFVILWQVSASFGQVYVHLWTATRSNTRAGIKQHSLIAHRQNPPVKPDPLPPRTAPLFGTPAHTPGGSHAPHTA